MYLNYRELFHLVCRFESDFVFNFVFSLLAWDRHLALAMLLALLCILFLMEGRSFRVTMWLILFSFSDILDIDMYHLVCMIKFIRSRFVDLMIGVTPPEGFRWWQFGFYAMKRRELWSAHVYFKGPHTTYSLALVTEAPGNLVFKLTSRTDGRVQTVTLVGVESAILVGNELSMFASDPSVRSVLVAQIHSFYPSSLSHSFGFEVFPVLIYRLSLVPVTSEVLAEFHVDGMLRIAKHGSKPTLQLAPELDYIVVACTREIYTVWVLNGSLCFFIYGTASRSCPLVVALSATVQAHVDSEGKHVYLFFKEQNSFEQYDFTRRFKKLPGAKLRWLAPRVIDASPSFLANPTKRLGDLSGEDTRERNRSI